MKENGGADPGGASEISCGNAQRGTTYAKMATVEVVRVLREEESVFRKLLSSIGIGGAKVDTRLSAESLMPGEPVSGVVYIFGGDEAQEFNRIYLSEGHIR